MGYFKEVIQKIKKRVTGTDRKKLTENAIIIVIIGIILLLAAGPILGIKKEGSASETINSQNKGDSSNLTPVNADHTERKLEELLSGMSGAGKVQVMITYYNGIEKITAYDIKKSSSETEEIDSEGGKRTIIESEYESTTLYEDVSSGIRLPVVLKEIYPEVKGVVVVAEGAGNAEVREKITRAVSVLMDIPVHRVQVFERKK
jgi:stage III sporulation protein AG